MKSESEEEVVVKRKKPRGNAYETRQHDTHFDTPLLLRGRSTGTHWCTPRRGARPAHRAFRRAPRRVLSPPLREVPPAHVKRPAALRLELRDEPRPPQLERRGMRGCGREVGHLVGVTPPWRPPTQRTEEAERGTQGERRKGGATLHRGGEGEHGRRRRRLHWEPDYVRVHGQ